MGEQIHSRQAKEVSSGKAMSTQRLGMLLLKCRQTKLGRPSSLAQNLEETGSLASSKLLRTMLCVVHLELCP